MQEIEKNCQSTISARGINFRVYAANNRAEEKKWPLDIIPRIIPKPVWNKISKGLKQRAKALNAFLADIYNQGEIIKANIIPKEIIYKKKSFEPSMFGFSPPRDIYSPIIGIDLVRTGPNEYFVLEKLAF